MDETQYVAVYEVDLLSAMEDPRSFLDHLIQVYKYKLEGDEPLSFHFGCDSDCDSGCDPDGTCYYQTEEIYK